MQSLDYWRVRPHMRTGDLIFFWGRGYISTIIRARTMLTWPFWGPNPSHVGVVWETWGNQGHPHRIELMESTSLDGIAGVTRTYLSRRLKTYGGHMAYASCMHSTSAQQESMHTFLAKQQGKPYDTMGAIEAGSFIMHAEYEEVAQAYFCSELAAAAWQQAGLLTTDVLAGEQTPKDAVGWIRTGPLWRLQHA